MHSVCEISHGKLQCRDFGQLELVYNHGALSQWQHTHALHKLWSVVAQFLIASALELFASFNILDNIF